jgi:uncharacterized protein (DUF1501 family)
MLTRRQMLERSLLMSLSPVVPVFLAKTARAAEPQRDRRVLVVVQLDGGNDGLNTVVPFRDENYARLRPKLKLPPERLIKLSDELALHPAMKAVGGLFDDGRLSIVQGVGYPNPNRSHFQSMAIWHSGRLEESEHGQYGWLGRALDERAAATGAPHAVFASPGPVPMALWGRRSTTAVIRSKEELILDAPTDLLQTASMSAENSSELARFAAAASRDAFTTCERLAPLLTASRETTLDDPPTRLAAHLAIISALIKADSPARVFYAVQSGYDTHATQSYDHYRLLGELSRALETFFADLTASGLADRVLLVAFSEFSRRAAENASEGTDHGAAGPVLVAGTNLAAGIIGPPPNLSDLEQGDIRMSIDFRQLYATILDQWLDVRPADVLSGKFEQLRLFRA